MAHCHVKRTKSPFLNLVAGDYEIDYFTQILFKCHHFTRRVFRSSAGQCGGAFKSKVSSESQLTSSSIFLKSVPFSSVTIVRVLLTSSRLKFSFCNSSYHVSL